MEHYVDGCLLAVLKKNLDQCRRMAGKFRIELGAWQFVDTVVDDVRPAKVTPLLQAVKLKRAKTVVFSTIAFRSRAHRDNVNAKVMADLRIASWQEKNAIPIDAKGMIRGGFRTIVASVSGKL